MIIFDATIQQRRDTAANWTAANPVLANGEFGYETDTGKLKVGDGATAWNALPYFAGTGGMGSVNFSAGTTSQNLTNLVFSNSHGVSFGLNGSTITGSVATNYLTTAMASNRGSDFVQATAAFAGTNASGTINSTGISVSVAAPGVASVNFSAGTTSSNLSAVTFSNSNGVSFGLGAAGVITGTVATNYQSQGAYLTTAMASNRGSDFVQATAAFAGTNASGTINSTGISVSVAAQSVNSVKFSAGTLSSNRTDITFSNSNGVSFGLETNGVITATIATTYAGTGYTTATTAGTNLVGTLNSAGLSQGVPAFLTTAAISQDSSKYAGTGFTTATTAGTAIVGTQNTAGLSMGVPAFLTTAMQSNAATISNILVSAGTVTTNGSAFTFSNSNNVSFGLGTGASAGVITASYTVPTVTNSSWTVSDNATSGTVGRLAFTNLNGVTLSLSSGTGGLHTIVGSIATGVTNINVSAGGSSNNLTNLVFSNSNDVSFGLNASTITADIRNFKSYWFNLPFAGMGSMTVVQSTSYIAPFCLPYYVSASYIRLPASFGIAQTTFATTANTQFTAQLFSTINAVVYSLGTGASSGSLQSVVSGSAPFAVKYSWSAGNTGSQWSLTASITYPTRGTTSLFSTTDFTTQTNLSIQSSLITVFNSFRYLDIPFANSLSPGPYWLMIGVSSTTSTQGAAGGTNQIISCSTQIVTQSNAAMGDLGAAVPASQMFQLGVGSFSTNAIGTTASLDLTNVTRSANVPLLQMVFARQA